MTPEQLKASILQYAIQGKLVEQRAEEGTGEELYWQIQAEKQQLIQEKKIKKEKPLAEISEDEIPFDIPESWKWVRIPEIGTSSLGKTLNKSIDAGKEVNYLCSINVYWEGISLDQVKTAKFSAVDMEKYLLQRGDLLVCEGGDVGRSAVWDSNTEMYYQNALHCVRFFGGINPYFFRYCFELYKWNKILENASKGMTIKHLVQGSLHSILFPLPPLAEQKRIVAKIEELLPLVDRYAASYEKLEQFIAKFPEDMKKSILQYAIQGKLVEQRAEEGTGEELYQQIQAEKQRLIQEKKIKKEKPLAEISEDDIPFDIPESWKWVRLSDIIDVRDGTHDSPKYVPEGIPLVTSKNLSNGMIDYGNVKYITQEDADKINTRSMVEDDDILFAMIGSIGNPVLVKKEREFCIKNMALFKKYANTDISMQYMYWFFFFIQYKLKKEASGGVQSFISLSRFREYLVPLPPFAEQKRIVAKIEELLPLCERLK